MDNFIELLNSNLKKNKILSKDLTDFLKFHGVKSINHRYNTKIKKIEKCYDLGFNTIDLFHKNYKIFLNSLNNHENDDECVDIKGFLNKQKTRFLCNKLKIIQNNKTTTMLKNEIVDYCKKNNKDLNWVKNTINGVKIIENNHIDYKNLFDISLKKLDYSIQIMEKLNIND